MRSIRISDEVWEAIAARGRFGETEDDVLRREFSIPSASEQGDNSQQTQPRYATTRMTATVQGDQLYVGFASGANKRWDLPGRNDRSALHEVRSEAVQWARNQGASPGQQDAVKKALTSAGYHLRR